MLKVAILYLGGFLQKKISAEISMGALVMDIGRICVVYISVEYLVLAIVF